MFQLRSTRWARGLIAMAIALALVVMATATPAQARPRPRNNTAPFVANKTFGLGIMFGAPTGLSGKYYLSSDTAIDFGLGVYRRFRHHEAVQLHADFLWHPVVLAEADPFILPLYFGIGARILDHDRHEDFHDDEGTHLGVRAPIGILMDFNRVPIDIFFELALVVDLFIDGHDHGHIDLDGAIGFRYYF